MLLLLGLRRSLRQVLVLLIGVLVLCVQGRRRRGLVLVLGGVHVGGDDGLVVAAPALSAARTALWREKMSNRRLGHSGA